MKEVTIGGVTYLPASAIAKQFRYTTDYIGQLCRSKKVDAELVGRTWYVNPISLESHKKSKTTKKSARISKLSKAEAQIEVESKDIATPIRIMVEPTVSKTTIKALAASRRLESDNPDKHFARRIDWQPLRYETDESDLLPRLVKIAPVKMRVDLAESTDIAIKSNSKPTKLVADELPTVSLKGHLKVTSLEEGLSFSETDDAETVLVPDHRVETSEVAIVSSRSVPAVRPVEYRPLSSLAPSFRTNIPDADTETELVLADTTSAPSFPWLPSILVLTVFLVTTALLLLLQSEVIATARDSATTLVFSSADVLDLLKTF